MACYFSSLNIRLLLFWGKNFREPILDDGIMPKLMIKPASFEINEINPHNIPA
jgi:hypothetical protein